MSFALTTPQIRARTKTVTRRTGWAFLKRGDLLQPIVKGQGLKKGEKAERVGGPIRVENVRREPLKQISKTDVIAEGFPELTAREFIEFFCQGHRIVEEAQEGGVLSPFVKTWRLCTPDDEVTRIEFSYVDAVA